MASFRNNQVKAPGCTIEYTSKRSRVTRHFDNASEAKRFYANKLAAGKNPKVIGKRTNAKADEPPQAADSNATPNAGHDATNGQSDAVQTLSDAAKRPSNGHGTPSNSQAAKSSRFDAVYVRVSSDGQSTRSQLPDLERWMAAQDRPVKMFTDKLTGTSMDRPAWQRIETAIKAGKVSSVVVWRLDRLGRTASGLTALFDELQRQRVNLVSIKDGVDLSTPAGRMLAGVLASVAQYETEVRQERQAAGIAAAKAAGKTWGGSVKGVRKKVTAEQEAAIIALRKDATPIKRIAAAVGLSRPTVYAVLAAVAASNA